MSEKDLTKKYYEDGFEDTRVIIEPPMDVMICDCGTVFTYNIGDDVWYIPTKEKIRKIKLENGNIKIEKTFFTITYCPTCGKLLPTGFEVAMDKVPTRVRRDIKLFFDGKEE